MHCHLETRLGVPSCELRIDPKERCALCYQWVPSIGLRKHLRTFHDEFELHESAITKQVALWQKIIVSPCQACGAVVADRRQHAGSCLALAQLMLMSCLLVGHCTSQVGSAGSTQAGAGPVGGIAPLPSRRCGGSGEGGTSLRKRQNGGRRSEEQGKELGKRRRVQDNQHSASQNQSRKGQGKGGTGKGAKKEASKMDVNEAVQLMAAVTLQLVDQSNRIQLDTGFLMTMKNEAGPENMLPIMYRVWAQWKKLQAEEPAKLERPLRCSMMIALLTEVKTRAQKLLEQALQLVVKPENMPRFQSRELAPEMKRYAVAVCQACACR